MGLNTLKNQDLAYKFKQEGVLSESSDAAGKTQDEHNTSDDNEQPNRVKAPEVCYGWQIGQHALGRGGGGRQERRVTNFTNNQEKENQSSSCGQISEREADIRREKSTFFQNVEPGGFPILLL